MKQQLYLLLNEFVTEFNQKKIFFLQDQSFRHAIRFGNYAVKGSKRYSKSYGYDTAFTLDTGVLPQLLGNFIRNFATSKKLYDFVAEHNLWCEKFDSFEDSQQIMPSIITRIGGGFLCRNFELNGNEFEITQRSFDTAFNELLAFFGKDIVEYYLYAHLRGCNGDIDSISLTEDVSIVKADYEMAKFYSINYYVNQVHGIEMFEGDYLLKIKFVVPKTEYRSNDIGKHNLIERQTLDKWLHVPLLAISGFVDLGKRTRFSDDWPLLYNRIIGPFGNESKLPENNFSKITDQTVLKLNLIGSFLQNLRDITAIDENIKHSIERLRKSKSSKDINDRTVELAMAFEYLINTHNTEVTYQLTLKAIKLFDPNNIDREIFKNLKKFYNFRSKVVHGNAKLDVKIATPLIDYAEGLLQKIIVRMIELNQKYTYIAIDTALSESIYISKPIEELLDMPAKPLV